VSSEVKVIIGKVKEGAVTDEVEVSVASPASGTIHTAEMKRVKHAAKDEYAGMTTEQLVDAILKPNLEEMP